MHEKLLRAFLSVATIFIPADKIDVPSFPGETLTAVIPTPAPYGMNLGDAYCFRAPNGESHIYMDTPAVPLDLATKFWARLRVDMKGTSAYDYVGTIELINPDNGSIVREITLDPNKKSNDMDSVENNVIGEIAGPNLVKCIRINSGRSRPDLLRPK